MEIEKMFAEDPAQMPLAEAEIKIDPKEDESEVPKEEKKNHQDRRWDRLMGTLDKTNEELSELRKFKDEVESGKYSAPTEVPDHFKKLYEEGLTMEERWKYQSQYETELAERLAAKAKADVYRELDSKQKEQDKWEDFIDEKLEGLEGKYGVDFTSGSAKADRLKKDFLKTVADLSPTDDNGNITGYASFDKSFEMWTKSKNDKDTTVQRKKDISGLGNGKSSPNSDPEPEIGEGGMWGWMKHVK